MSYFYNSFSRHFIIFELKLFIMKTIIMFMLTLSTALAGSFEDALKLYENRDYFRFTRNAPGYEMNEWQHLLIKSFVLNLTGDYRSSSDIISSLLKDQTSDINDSLKKMLLEVKMKNSVNIGDYKTAADISKQVLNEYSAYLDSAEIVEVKNSMVIWAAASGISPCNAQIKGDIKINTSRDLAGLINVPVTCNGIDEDFIFDTGANFSVVNSTYAKKMNLKMLDGKVMVGSVTGADIESQLAVAEELLIGSVNVKNVLFLVMPDESLSFAGGLYVIKGIIGLPVIRQLHEVHINNDNIFIPKLPVKSNLKNLLIDGFVTIIEVIEGNDSLAFTFDTGAKRTMLYSSYYNMKKPEIDKKYELEDIEFGGAGGTVKVKGFKLDDVTFRIGSSKQVLSGISLLAEQIKDHDKSYFGNLGQDYMGSFDKMILNFDDMYVDFK